MQYITALEVHVGGAAGDNESSADVQYKYITQCNTVQNNVLPYSGVQYSTLQHKTIRCRTEHVFGVAWSGGSTT